VREQRPRRVDVGLPIESNVEEHVRIEKDHRYLSSSDR
jgi:hypothetical protein